MKKRNWSPYHRTPNSPEGLAIGTEESYLTVEDLQPAIDRALVDIRIRYEEHG